MSKAQAAIVFASAALALGPAGCEDRSSGATAIKDAPAPHSNVTPAASEPAPAQHENVSSPATRETTKPAEPVAAMPKDTIIEKPVAGNGDIVIKNIAEDKVDSVCLADKVTAFKALIDSNGLDPLKVEVFAGHPIVTAALKVPYVDIPHNGKHYLVPLTVTKDSKVLAVTQLKSGPDYAAYEFPAKSGFSMAGCVKK